MTKKYNIILHNKYSKNLLSFECFENQFILDAAEENNIELPYACRAGTCSTCLGKIVTGNVNQSLQSFLDEKQLANNFVLLCVAYPSSNVEILTHEEENLY